HVDVLHLLACLLSITDLTTSALSQTDMAFLSSLSLRIFLVTDCISCGLPHVTVFMTQSVVHLMLRLVAARVNADAHAIKELDVTARDLRAARYS
ncbi:hypothetical protein DFH29DRAFT_948177, partial [Suillus ampliporus]